MGRRGFQIVFFGVIAIGIAALLWTRAGRGDPRAESGPAAPRSRSTSVSPKPAVVEVRGAGPNNEPAPEGESRLADELNAPGGTIQRDLSILAEIFATWQTNFPRTGNPVGENAEITAALAGDNALKFAFVPRRHPAINAAGELCDRWGTPFRFHQLSGTQMEVRSAGPDRKFGTADDVRLGPQ